MGIKGMGQSSAEAIVREREKNGPFKNFMDFMERMNSTDANKRVIDVLIKTGAFDKLGQNRATLLANYEAVMAYEEKKRAGSEFGQASLFEEAGVKEFADYVFTEVEDMPTMEQLNMEKELIGCYVSGHPLDDWRKAIETCATVNSETIGRAAKESKATQDALAASGQKPWATKNAGRTYTAIGMVQELRTIMTKKGKQMGFAKLADFKGTIDITFFPQVWEQLREKVQTEGVYAFKGKVDGSRDTPSFLVDTMEDPAQLQEKAISSVHIQMQSGFSSVKEINSLKDFLFEPGYLTTEVRPGRWADKSLTLRKYPTR